MRVNREQEGNPDEHHERNPAPGPFEVIQSETDVRPDLGDYFGTTPETVGSGAAPVQRKDPVPTDKQL